MARVVLGLGANLGDREANLRRGLARLAERLRIETVSSVYASEPVGYSEQPEFWNLVVLAESALDAGALLAVTQAIERELGRTAGFRNAPRPLDIDILLYDDLRTSTPRLELPHPRMLERAFVLRPLVEVAPDLPHPVTGRTMAEHLLEGEGSWERVERLFPGTRLLTGESAS